jgi:hypothetical protein
MTATADRDGGPEERDGRAAGEEERVEGEGADEAAPSGAGAGTGAGEEGEAAAAFFHAVEEAFVRLRGAPLLLSPADFQVAARWRREGVPLGLVLATLEEVFAKRRERGARGRINSLRYCAPAVDAAWQEVQELQGPARREGGSDLAVAERLAELALALPAGVEWEPWRARLLAFEGAPAEVEEELQRLDDELLEHLEGALASGDRERLTAEVEAIVEGLRDRFPDAELVALRERLFRQRLRRARALPVLSLFA